MYTSEFIQVHLGDTPHNLVESDFEYLASKTEGFSGSDIAVCVSSNFFAFFLTLCQEKKLSVV
jgi:SpoVK/Ycf46/Vps4 family AAA+-type ATPase